MPCPPRMRGCRRGCLHRDRIEGYYSARDAQLDRAEEVTLAYETETEHFFHPQNGIERRIVLKDWLIATANPEDSAA